MYVIGCGMLWFMLCHASIKIYAIYIYHILMISTVLPAETDLFFFVI